MESRKQLMENVIKTYSFDLDYAQSGHKSFDDLMIDNIIPKFFTYLEKEKTGFNLKILLPFHDSWLTLLFYNYYLIDNLTSFGSLRYPRKLLLSYLKVIQQQQFGLYRPLDLDTMFSETDYFGVNTYFVPGKIIKQNELILEVQNKKYVIFEFLNIPPCYIGEFN